MILESVLSCSYLLLTCGSSVYTLRKESYSQYSKLLPHFPCAFFGMSAIGARSVFVLVYKLFLKTYTFDPTTMEIEEEKDRSRINIYEQLLGTIGMASLIYSVYCHHGYYFLGAFVVSSLTIYDLVVLRKTIVRGVQESQAPEDTDLATDKPQTGYSFVFWVIIHGYFAHVIGNKYALVANYPFLVTTWSFPPEGFYQGWTIRRTIHDYMMSAYVILMTIALRQPRTV